MFNSTDENDRTEWPSRFEQQERLAIGGNFICVHWRRGDFLRAHARDLPSVKEAAKQVFDIAFNV